MTGEDAQKFAEICQRGKDFDPDQLIINEIGEVEFNNVGQEGHTRDKNSAYVSEFRKQYQVYISRFNTLRAEYEGTGLRKFPDVPLRIEIDKFLWWIREYNAPGNSYQIGYTRIGDKFHRFVEPLIREFVSDDDPDLEEQTVPRFKEIAQGFASREKIESMDIEMLYENLLKVHAFSSSRRFKGGHDKMKEVFLEENSVENIKKTVLYLLFGDEDYAIRIDRCVSNPEFKLQDFGENSVKELYGLVNPNDIPICNGRTLKSMEWLGFGKLG